MSILQQYFHAIGAFNAVCICLLLASSKALNAASKVLMCWCLAWALYALSPLIIINTPFSSAIFLQTFSSWALASFGALFYLYLLLTINGQSFTKRDGLAFLPLVICLWLNLDYAGMSNLQFGQFVSAGEVFDVQHIIGLVFLYGQAIYFLVKSYRLIRQYQYRAETNLSNFDPSLFRSLMFILLANASLWLLELSSSVFGINSVLAIISDILFTLYLCWLGLLHWKVPNFLILPELTDRSVLATQNNDMKTSDSKRQTSKTEGILNTETCQEIYLLTQQYVEQHHAFLDSELTITKLSEQLGLSKHYVSEAINRNSSLNFHQFINEYRVEWFCKKLKLNNKAKLLDLALESGFSSKSAFNQVFKRVVGQTPSQFRAALLQD